VDRKRSGEPATSALIQPAVTFVNVSLQRGPRRILSRINLSIAPGEFVGIIGENGSGKSTLLRMTLGLLAPTSGEIHVFGKAPAATRGVFGYVPQRIELDPDLPLRARDYVSLGIDGTHFGLPLPNPRRRARVAATLAAVGASHLAEQRIGRLSGGEQQRIAIAQAIAAEPRLLLLDEPLANLDLASAAEIVELVARLGRERNMTVMLVAHDINPLMRVMDRVLYLAGGRAALGTVAAIVNEDTLSRLYDRPVDVLRVRGRVIVVAGEEPAHGHDSPQPA
jgi:zinc/manganese transport system ATP-binding protein